MRGGEGGGLRAWGHAVCGREGVGGGDQSMWGRRVPEHRLSVAQVAICSIHGMRIVAPASELEGAPSVIEAVWVGETDVSPGSAVLRVTGLHPEDVLRDTGLNGHRQAAHAAGCA